MRKSVQFIAVSSFVLVSLFSCGKKSEEKQAETKSVVVQNEVKKEEVKEEVQKKSYAVCLWDKLSLKEAPNKKGKWITGLNFGEVAEFLEESAIDSTDKNKKYLKVRLSDGKTGWANAYCLIENSEAATITEETQLYKRPDLVTMQIGVKLAKMDIVAIGNTQDEWVEVFGKEKKKQGWIKNNSFSTDKIDFAVALLYSKITTKDNAKRVEALKQLSDNGDFVTSKFIDTIKEEISILETPAAVENETDNDAETSEDNGETEEVTSDSTND